MSYETHGNWNITCLKPVSYCVYFTCDFTHAYPFYLLEIPTALFLVDKAPMVLLIIVFTYLHCPQCVAPSALFEWKNEPSVLTLPQWVELCFPVVFLLQTLSLIDVNAVGSVALAVTVSPCEFSGILQLSHYCLWIDAHNSNMFYTGLVEQL